MELEQIRHIGVLGGGVMGGGIAQVFAGCLVRLAVRR